MTEWKEYTGSDESICEIADAIHGVLLRYKCGKETLIVTANRTWGVCLDDVTHYLICNPHPLADMICQQARTGRPVWVKEGRDFDRYGYAHSYHQPTTTPDWNIPGAEYSFTPFDEESNK